MNRCNSSHKWIQGEKLNIHLNRCKQRLIIKSGIIPGLNAGDQNRSNLFQCKKGSIKQT